MGYKINRSHRLRATFFCYPNGDVIQKAKPLSPGQRMAIYERDRGVCFCCGIKCEFFTPGCSYGFIGNKPKANIDHILPRSRGGQNTDDNLATSCESCNKSKGAGL